MTIQPQSIPTANKMFAPTTDAYGSRLALVFGNESHTGACPFYGHGCFHCDIGAGEGPFTPDLNMQRLEFYKQNYTEVLSKLDHLVLYNSGSLLNEHELSSKTLQALLTFARSLPNCRIVSIDSREMFVTREKIQEIINGLRLDQKLRITFGLESQDDHIRCSVLAKRMTKVAIEQAFNILSQFKEQAGAELNMVFQAPGVEESKSIIDSNNTIRYGLELSKKYQIPVDFNFHPYYPSISGTKHFPNHPRSQLEDAVSAITQGIAIIKESGCSSKLYIGWNDEGHDQDEKQRAQETHNHLAGFIDFNQTQDPQHLKIEAY